MKKRILSIILSIVMLVGLLPTTAWASHTYGHEGHYDCHGSCHVDRDPHKTVKVRDWTVWDGTDKDDVTLGDQLTAGSYYLTGNVEVNSVTIVGEVNLCLNGRTITTTNGYGAFHVKSGATLNICDCSTSLPGKIENTNASTDYPGIRNNGGTVNVYGGTVSGAHTGIINKNNNGGTVNVYGGTVSGTNTGIKNEQNSNLNIYNGTAQATGSTGYGIYNQGTVSVSGGIVTGGSNGIHNYYTGTINVSGTVQVSGTTGIYNDGGTFNVSGGTVTAIGNSGSGIYNSGTGTLTVSGGTVTANNGSSKGISNSGTLNLQGAPSITGAAADIYLNSDKLITIGEGGLTYTSDKAISVRMNTPGTFTSGWTTKMGENAANYDSYFISANDGYIVQPDGNNELELADPSATISVTGVELDKSSLTLGVGSTETLTATVEPSDATNKAVTWSSNAKSVATVENGVVTAVSEGTATITATTTDGGITATCTVTVVPVHEHLNCGVANCTNTTHNHSEVDEWTELTKENIKTYVTKSDSSYILTPGSYYLGEDITLSDVANDCTFIYMNASGTYNVCLNGNTITGSGSAPVFRANDTNAVLSICDCSEPSTGKITGGYSQYGGGVCIDYGTVNLYGGSITGNSAYQQGAGVYVTNGTFNMYGGSISNNTFTSGSDRKGGGVHVSSGTFNMYGGTISDHVSSNGGGVYVASGTFNMSGGTISGNTASTYGGGVYVYSGTFTMTGGEITGNNANNYSGGVYNRAGKFNVSGSPVVTDNTVGTAENNVYCINEITITGTLTADAQIGVNYSSERIFTSGWTAAMGESETDYEKYFTSDNSGFEIVKNDSGELELKKSTIPVIGVELDKSSITLDVNGTAELAATVFPDDATDKTVSWTSSDPTVAKVENGVVTALKPGTVTITVTTNDDSFTDTCTVTVNKIAITGMLEITTENEPVVGERFTIGSVTYTPGNYTISATSFSPSASDSPIQAGKVYTLSVTFKPYSGYFFGENIQATFNGEAVEITRLDIGGTIYLQIEHTYSFPAAVPNSVDILRNGAPADTASILLPGINENAATMDFTAKTLDQYGQEMTGQTVEWSITGTNTTGISVNNGTVTVTEDASKGNYTLTATCDGKSDSITIKVEKAESVATSIKIFKGENEVTADTIYIPEQYRNTVNYTAVVYDQYGEVMSADDAEITKTHTNKTIDNLTIASTEVESNRSWDYFVDAASGKAGSFDLVLTSGNASASVRITFAVLTPQTIICANVTGTYGQTEEVKLNPSGKQTAGAYGFAIKSGASTDVVEVASDGKLTIKNAGETTIVVTAPSDATHASASVEVKVTIDKADITEYTDPTANDLTYNGSAQALITEGSATGGTMYYALGGSYNPTRDWSTNVPTGTDAKTYYVWYKVVGDRNHNNKNFETPITVTIAPNTYIVTYLPGINGTGTQTTDTKTQGVDLTLKGAIFTRTGYTQTGWATTDGGEKVYDLNGTYSANAAVSLYPVWTANTYTVTLNAGGATINSNNVTGYTYGVGATLPAAGDMTKASHRFDGWYESDNFGGSPVTAISTTATGDKTYYAKWTEVHTITGVVKDSESNGIDGVTVKLMQGNDQFGTTTTANRGQFSFTSVPLGSYNVVAEQTVSGGTKTKTEMVIIEHENAELTITMPEKNVSSKLEVGSGTPDVVVGGLDDEAADQTHSNAAGSDIHVSIGMSIEAKEDVTSGDSGSSEEASQQTTIKQAASAQQLDKVEFLSITVTKTVTTNGTPDNGTELKQTQTVLELIIPYSLAGKYNIGIYRHHDGRAEAFAALGSQPDEQAKRDKTFWIDTGKELIHIYTNRFSNYAIAYSDAPVVTPTPNPTPSGGDYTPTYAIIVEDAENGEIKANRSYASSGSTVTITVTPEDGYALDELTVTDSQGNRIELTDKGDGTFTFKMPSRKVTVEAVFVPDGSFSTCTGGSACPIYPYTDADPAAWYHDGVHYCIENGLMAGYGNNIFKPDAATTRGMLAVMLWRLEGSPVVNYALNFEDVAEGQWYTEAIRWAVSEGIATGYGNGYFGTNDAITREQLAAMLWRYAGSPESSRSLDHFGDAMEVSGYAVEALAWANEHGIVVGVGNNTLSPQSHATRAQVATMLMRMVQATTK